MNTRSKREVDKFSYLPDVLICHILSNLPTKVSVKTSVLSTRWRYLWRYLPLLDVHYLDFPDVNGFMTFVLRFLAFNVQGLQHFKLCTEKHPEEKYEWLLEFESPEVTNATWWIDIVLNRKVQHLHVRDPTWEFEAIPREIYNCESLVSLKLCHVNLATPKVVSLPFLKVVHLDTVKFVHEKAFEDFISGCPVLERLITSACSLGIVDLRRVDWANPKFVSVCSQSLLSFTHSGDTDRVGLVVLVDAPKLEYLKLSDHKTASFVVKNLVSLVEVDLDISFSLSSWKKFDPYDLPKRKMIRDFLHGISNVKHMVISSFTLEAIYSYSRCEQLQIFHNISSVRANYRDTNKWEMLPVLLERCPNIKTLFLEFDKFRKKPPILPRPHCFLPSLEYVNIVPMIEEAATVVKLASYFLQKSKILKKLTLCLRSYNEKEASAIRKKLLTIPRRSSSCQIAIL